MHSIIRPEILLKWFWLQTNSFLKIWLLCVNFEKFASKPTNEPTIDKRWALLDGRFIGVNFSKLTHNNQIFRNDFVIIIISVNFQLKQLSAKFLPLTISCSCCSIPISSLVLSFTNQSSGELFPQKRASFDMKMYLYSVSRKTTTIKKQLSDLSLAIRKKLIIVTTLSSDVRQLVEATSRAYKKPSSASSGNI